MKLLSNVSAGVIQFEYFSRIIKPSLIFLFYLSSMPGMMITFSQFLVLLLAILSFTFPMTTVMGQQAVSSAASTAVPTQYTDEEHGFRVQLPANWFVDDAADYGEGDAEELSTPSLELLGMGGAPAGTICPQEAGELQIGGEIDCAIPEGSDLITIGIQQYRFDLEHMQSSLQT